MDRKAETGGHDIAFRALLEKPGVYRISIDGVPAADQPTQVELRVGRGWAAMTAWAPADAPAGPEGALAAAGLTPPPARGTSPSERAWFRSWIFRTPAEMGDASAAMFTSARTALDLQPGGDLRVGLLPWYRGDPRVAITAVLGCAYVLYCFLVDWLVLLAWDVLFPDRAHATTATVAQVLVPAASVALFVAYVVALPRLRLRWVARHRPPTPGEVDGNVRWVTPLALVSPPLLMLLLLVVATSA